MADENFYTVTATATINYQVPIKAQGRFEAANALRQAIGAAVMAGPYAPESLVIDWEVTSGTGGK